MDKILSFINGLRKFFRDKEIRKVMVFGTSLIFLVTSIWILVVLPLKQVYYGETKLPMDNSINGELYLGGTTVNYKIEYGVNIQEQFTINNQIVDNVKDKKY